jgi:hypothetical protein
VVGDVPQVCIALQNSKRKSTALELRSSVAESWTKLETGGNKQIRFPSRQRE